MFFMLVEYSVLILKLEHFSKKLNLLLYKLKLIEKFLDFENFQVEKKAIGSDQLAFFYKKNALPTINIIVKLFAFYFNSQNPTVFITPIASTTKKVVFDNRNVLNKEKVRTLKNRLFSIQLLFLEIYNILTKIKASLFIGELEIEKLTRKPLKLRINSPSFLLQSRFCDHCGKKMKVADVFLLCKTEVYDASLFFEKYLQNLELFEVFLKQ